jgi:hypothetical protein
VHAISRARLVWAILGIVVLVASGWGVTLAATARPSSAVSSPYLATSHDAGTAVGTLSAAGLAGTGTGVPTAGAGTVTAASTSPAVSYQAWCCSSGNPLGLTATGQATVHGGGATARDSAIARAVADAEAQAKAAAQEAGISLGRIINIEVSAPYYPYPLPLGAAGAGSATGPPAAPGVSGAPGSGAPTSVCATRSQCPYPVVNTYASVTVTWAIG